MNPSISIVVVVVLAVVTAVQSDPYHINFGDASYTRLIDEFSIASPAKPYREIKLSLDYPGGIAWRQTFIRRIEYIDYNKRDARSEFRIVKGGCDHESVVFHITSKMGKAINSTILFYGPMP